MWKKIIFVILIGVVAKFYLDYGNTNRKLTTTEEYGNDDNDSASNDTPLSVEESQTKIYSKEELLATITNSNKLLLAVLGKVYDVTKGAKHYQKGGSYEFFVGVDGSRAFTTGKFEKDLTDDLDGLDESSIADIFNWQEFFETTYTYVGKVNGRFYDHNGDATPYFHHCDEIYKRHKKKEKQRGDFNKRFPSCNSEWSQDRGGLVKVWCSKQSGGVERDWIGFPRLVYNPYTKTEQCCCLNENELNHPSVKTYENCDPFSIQCNFL